MSNRDTFDISSRGHRRSFIDPKDMLFPACRPTRLLLLLIAHAASQLIVASAVVTWGKIHATVYLRAFPGTYLLFSSSSSPLPLHQHQLWYSTTTHRRLVNHSTNLHQHAAYTSPDQHSSHRRRNAVNPPHAASGALPPPSHSHLPDLFHCHRRQRPGSRHRPDPDRKHCPRHCHRR